MNDFGVRPCCVHGCSEILPRTWELPVCKPCGVKIAVAFMWDAERMEAVSAERVRRQEEHVANRRRGKTADAVVYYIAIGEYVKIGFTSDLKQRVSSLRARPDQVLAIEPGGRDLEQQRHREFAAERLDGRRENFQPSDRLLAHTAALRETHPLPRWATLPSNQVTTRRKT